MQQINADSFMDRISEDLRDTYNQFNTVTLIHNWHKGLCYTLRDFIGEYLENQDV